MRPDTRRFLSWAGAPTIVLSLKGFEEYGVIVLGNQTTEPGEQMANKDQKKRTDKTNQPKRTQKEKKEKKKEKEKAKEVAGK